MEADQELTMPLAPTIAPVQSERQAVRTRIDPRSGKVLQMHGAGFWREHVEAHRRSGLTVRQYSEAQGLALSTFRRWCSNLNGPKGARTPGAMRRNPKPVSLMGESTFLSVPIHKSGAQAGASACATATATATTVEVMLAGMSVRFGGGPGAQVIEAVTATLRAALWIAR